MPPALVDRLQARQFTFVVGKGGTGKSTTASALALGSADSGRRTLLLSTDPAHSIADIFSIRLESGVRPASACSDDLLLEELNAETIAAAWLERARS